MIEEILYALILTPIAIALGAVVVAGVILAGKFGGWLILLVWGI